MSKILMVAAAAVLVSAPAMAAGTTTIGIDGHCNVFSVKVQNKTVVAARDVGCTSDIGGGFVGTIQHHRTATIAYTDSSLPGVQLALSLQYPFVTGGSWVLYATSDGKTMPAIDQGSYTVGTAAAALPPADKSLPPLGLKK